MMYRGYLIERLEPVGDALPWAFGIIGEGISGWARTRANAKRAVDRDIERREQAAFARVAAEAGLIEALEPAGHAFTPGQPRPNGNPPLCHVCGAGPSRHHA